MHREGDQLTVSEPGTRFGLLVPVSATRLHLVATSLDVEFASADGQAQRLLLRRANGQILTFHRV